ncbi:MAG: hypothetical protein WCS70_15840 [Verrucomicrobiota bacterium]
MPLIALREVQTVLTDAFATGLRLRYGPDLGALYREVAEYRPRVSLDEAALRRCVELDTPPAVQNIVANKVTGATLRAFRSLLIGGALLGDKSAVERWATEGLNRCQYGDGDWPTTRPQWQAVLKDPDGFIQMARQIKYYLNQL